MKRVLFLGSNSPSRQQLLRQAQIPFQVIGHVADESACEVPGISFQKLVTSIALAKMDHVNLGALTEHEDTCFILTADTMCMTKSGVIQGKPADLAESIGMIKDARVGASVGTAFCLDKRQFVDAAPDGVQHERRPGQWQVVKRIQKFVSTDYVFNVPDAWLEKYLAISPGLQAAGAISVEEFGDQFLQVVHGSYSNIIGLPMYELRTALEDIGFYAWLDGK